MILSKLLTPWPIGFVDLQSPTGSGFGVTLYNYDGDVYASDESPSTISLGYFKDNLVVVINAETF
jgi:hypothetical protein